AGGSGSLAQALEPGSPVLVVAPDTVPEPQEPRDLLARPIGEQPPTAWIWRGVPVAAYYSEPLMLLAHVERESEVFPHLKLLDAGTPRIEVAAERWNDASDVAGARVAERRLLGSLRRPSDGYLARFDRVLSVALSRALVRTAITPNVITALSLLVPVGSQSQHGVGVVADQSPPTRAAARIQAGLRTPGEPGLHLSRHGSHRGVAPGMVPVGGGRGCQPLLAQPVELGSCHPCAMTRRSKVLASLGALGLVVLLWRIDLNAVKVSLLHVGWGMALVLSQEVVAHALNGCAWRFAFTPESARRVSLGELIRLRVAGDAINYLTPTATIGGEVARTMLLSDACGGEARAVSVVTA